MPVGVRAKSHRTEEVSFESINPVFKGSIKSKPVLSPNMTKVVNFNLEDLSKLSLFSSVMGKKLEGRHICYIKVSFSDLNSGGYEWRTVGDNFIFEYSDFTSFDVFRLLIIDKLQVLRNRYEYPIDRINHIVVNLLPVNKSLINKFSASKSNFITYSVSDLEVFKPKPTSIIPISVNTK